MDKEGFLASLNVVPVCGLGVHCARCSVRRGVGAAGCAAWPDRGGAAPRASTARPAGNQRARAGARSGGQLF